MKKILTRSGLALVTVAVVIAGAAAFSAYEAHIVNVTATIENALTVPIDPIDYGTVFPQEAIDRNLSVALSSSFVSTDRVDDINYMIRQKPKCARQVPGQTEYEFAPVTENGQGQWVCPQDFTTLPVLCPYLSKHETTSDGQGENDIQTSTAPGYTTNGINAFHGPISGWTMANTLATQVMGRLAKSEQDTSDTWKIDFRAPCFQGECAQDWAKFVHDNNSSAVASDYILPQNMKGKLMGCDLWVEVTGVSQAEPRPTVGAALDAYVAPTTCNITVDDTGGNSALDTIQEGINAATAGQTVCVKAGTYTQDVVVNKPLTLVGDGSASTILTGVGTGYGGALTVASGIDNVTIEGFTVNGTGESAVYLTSNNDNMDVLYNRIVAATGKNALLSGGQQTNSTLSNNVFEGSGSQLVYVNGSASLGTTNASSNVDFTNNTFGGTATGPLLGIEANGSSITLNKFSGTTGYTSIETWEGNNLVNQNNFNVDAGTGPKHVTNSVHVTNTQFPGTLNAENNWWGDTDPSDNVTGLVDFTPSEASAFPQN